MKPYVEFEKFREVQKLYGSPLSPYTALEWDPVQLVVVLKCIYKPYVFSYSTAMSSAECSHQLGLWTAVDNM